MSEKPTKYNDAQSIISRIFFLGGGVSVVLNTATIVEKCHG